MSDAPWFVALEAALFAAIPREEPLDIAGVPVNARRELIESPPDLLYLVETWYDPRTEAVMREWRLTLSSAAVVGAPDWLVLQTVDVIVRALARERPIPRPRDVPRKLEPGRFAHGGASAQPRPR